MKKKQQITLDEKRDTVIGYVIRKGQAIDFTPIITFTINSPMQTGDIFEWDSATNELIYKGNSTTRA